MQKYEETHQFVISSQQGVWKIEEKTVGKCSNWWSKSAVQMAGQK